ncbi:MAG: hypothetical protein ACI9JM_001675 [Halioglobus sp.]|jgi:hypothetical protein
MRGAILCYHSQNCGGYDYSDNDHHAFAQDLREVAKCGIPIISLKEIATSLTTGKSNELPERFIALSCDDGTILDWEDYDHPLFGMQRSFANILRDHLSAQELEGKDLLTAFVIASPTARKSIDQGCYEGLPLSDDHWWPEAAKEGLIAIENHSWDHLHSVIPTEQLPHGSAGDFYSIDDLEKSQAQVMAAAEFINARLAGTSHRSSLFAYPYGHASEYLKKQYFPQYGEELGVVGAFTTEQNLVDTSSEVYALPRMVCGDAWRTPDEFKQLLENLLDTRK